MIELKRKAIDELQDLCRHEPRDGRMRQLILRAITEESEEQRAKIQKEYDQLADEKKAFKAEKEAWTIHTKAVMAALARSFEDEVMKLMCGGENPA